MKRLAIREIRAMQTKQTRSIRTPVAIALAALLLPSLSASAQDINRLGAFKKWSAYTATESGGKICFMYANPDNADGSPVTKPTAFFYVTQRPGEQIANDVSYIAGYLFQPDTLAYVNIGGVTFSFFTKEDAAWIEDVDLSAQFVAAMRRGNSMVISGTDENGATIRQNISLSGATAGSRAIINACA